MRYLWTLLLILALASPAFATSSGGYQCSGAANSSAAETPYDDNDWENDVNNACIDNGTETEITNNSYDSGDLTYVLYAKTYNMSVAGTIVGVTVRVNTHVNTGTQNLSLCQLLDTSGNRVGTNLCATPIPITSTDSAYVETLGGTSNTWGNALTDTWVNDADFGVALGFTSAQNNGDIYVDFVQVTIEYTTGGGGEQRRRMIMMQ